MGFLFGSGPKPPAPPPPPPNPPTLANTSVQQSGDQARLAAAAAAGMGDDNTLKTGSLGASPPSTATKSLLGS